MKMSRQFPLNALRVFEAVARLSSFTRAGEELGLTQTAVSYQIKLLEENIGEPLFLRRPRQITLTETGERLLPKVAQGFDLLGEAVSAARETAMETLDINATPTFAMLWLSRHLGAFQLRHSRIAVRLTTTQHVIDLAREGADVALRAGHGNWQGLVSHPLMPVDFTPMLSPKLADSIGGIETPADLLKLRIIDPADPWWPLWFTAIGHPLPDLSHQTPSKMGAQLYEAGLAIAGQGVAMLTPAFYTDDLASGRLIQPFATAANDGFHYWLVYPEARRNVRKIRDFRDWILEEFATAQT
ncbi:LysR family transcriptional regulator [Rhizobiaceae bacterium CRRU44]|uniref:LysR family transcriptional regulator n=1 Tax=Ferranicluibacter rubi TaxID=2715133 RepID=A0AA43ZG62_9HYPH|nr:LysR substrate-binding domain-containing protein [Ferranicluibacter rubi]NHT76343.1 LysR family transcriptional regulator [Ferranicluibacter rubi]